MTPVIRSTPLALVFAVALTTSAWASDLRTSLMRAGLSPETLAAAGVTSGQIEGIVADVEASNAGISNQLPTADASYATARAEVDELSRIVASGTASEEEVEDLAEAKTALAAAETAQATALTALFTAGKADLSGGVQTILGTLRSNLGQDAPTEFGTITRTDEEWLRLKRLLAHERVCAKTGDTPDSEAVAELAELRSNETVALAKTNLQTNLVTVKTAWNTATDD